LEELCFAVTAQTRPFFVGSELGSIKQLFMEFLAHPEAVMRISGKGIPARMAVTPDSSTMRNWLAMSRT